MSLGDHPDPYAHVAEELGRYRIAPLEGLPPFAGGAVGLFGYDLVRSAEPSVGEPEPRRGRHPRPGADDHRRAGGVRPPAPRGDGARERVRRRRRGPLLRAGRGRDRRRQGAPGRAGAADRRAAGASRPSSPRTWGRTASPRRSSAPRSTSAPATPTRSCRASAGRPTARSTPSRSTAACARSTRARTCTSSTSRTSRSRARRPSRSSRSAAGAWSCADRRAPGRARAPTRELADELLADEKERAEHVMLVDLGRNDLGPRLRVRQRARSTS